MIVTKRQLASAMCGEAPERGPAIDCVLVTKTGAVSTDGHCLIVVPEDVNKEDPDEVLVTPPAAASMIKAMDKDDPQANVSQADGKGIAQLDVGQDIMRINYDVGDRKFIEGWQKLIPEKHAKAHVLAFDMKYLKRWISSASKCGGKVLKLHVRAGTVLVEGLTGGGELRCYGVIPLSESLKPMGDGEKEAKK